MKRQLAELDKCLKTVLISLKRMMVPTLIALLLLGASYNIFLVNSSLNLGGFTGIAQIMAMMGIPYTPVLISLNVLPFGAAAKAAIKTRDSEFIFTSFCMTVLLGLVLDFFPKSNTFMSEAASLFIGSGLAGVGYGIICRIGASTGGTDMVAKCAIKYLGVPLSVAAIMTILDIIVIIIWAAVTQANIALSIASMIICNSAIEIVERYGRIREDVCALCKNIKHTTLIFFRDTTVKLEKALRQFRVVLEKHLK